MQRWIIGTTIVLCFSIGTIYAKNTPFVLQKRRGLLPGHRANGGYTRWRTCCNRRFRDEAEARGLIIDYDPKIGYSLTRPAQELLDLIQEYGWQDVSLVRQTAPTIPGGGSSGGSRSTVRKYQRPICGCSVRATKDVSIACLDCNARMFLVEK